jgi:hypothetical protein
MNNATREQIRAIVAQQLDDAYAEYSVPQFAIATPATTSGDSEHAMIQSPSVHSSVPGSFAARPSTYPFSPLGSDTVNTPDRAMRPPNASPYSLPTPQSDSSSSQQLQDEFSWEDIMNGVDLDPIVDVLHTLGHRNKHEGDQLQ